MVKYGIPKYVYLRKIELIIHRRRLHRWIWTFKGDQLMNRGGDG
jgi:hypothetical protein